MRFLAFALIAVLGCGGADYMGPTADAEPPAETGFDAAPCIPVECGPGECGVKSDGCGRTLECPGVCPSPLTCGGGGLTNQCGCSSKVNVCEGLDCGWAKDPCGHYRLCGSGDVETCGRCLSADWYEFCPEGQRPFTCDDDVIPLGCDVVKGFKLWCCTLF